jgi:hypothetical protein
MLSSGVPVIATLFPIHLLREMPLIWFLAGLLLAGLSLVPLIHRSAQSRFLLLRNLSVLAGSVVLLAYVVLSIYSIHSFMLQNDESNRLSIAAATQHGLPMYYPPASADTSVSLQYGPLTFLLYRAVLMAGGVDHFWILRASVIAANLAWFIALYLLIRRYVPTSVAVAMFAFPASIFMQRPEGSLGIRADIWGTLFAAVALLCAFLDVEVAALVLTGIMAGLFINLKISAGSAILFPLLILYRRFGLRGVLIPLPIATGVALLPFAFADISLRNYLAWIAFTGTEGLSHFLLSMNFIFALFLISPCVLMELFLRRYGMAFRDRLPEFLVIVLCLLMAVSTSKPGSGPWYFWHLVPSIVVYLGLTMRHLKDVPLTERFVPVYCIVMGCTLVACVNAPRAYRSLYSYRMTPTIHQAQQALNGYLDTYRGRSSIQMADGSVVDAESTLLRYILVFKGQPYTIDGDSGRFETMLLPFPVKVLDRMKTCKDDVWLVPHGQEPFTVYLFPKSLHQTFVENYRIDRSDEIYDAWVCHHSNVQ